MARGDGDGRTWRRDSIVGAAGWAALVTSIGDWSGQRRRDADPGDRRLQRGDDAEDDFGPLAAHGLRSGGGRPGGTAGVGGLLPAPVADPVRPDAANDAERLRTVTARSRLRVVLEHLRTDGLVTPG